MAWRKSTRSSDGPTCVEVAAYEDRRYIRDSTDPDGPVIALTPSTWTVLLHGIQAGAHDLPR
ncbi:DUF397 domain-containing protein [Actinomadura craniellae]|uniref:DUF397 domain-containing protein n=1 Tax=Actinomadura craniellae TaxID=2231787 RepID=A0A365GY58_9ACTN|nr:DUF397 domain-containing protein [Actinomadura craniellae]